MGREQSKGRLDMLLLSILRGPPLHGYGVITALREASAGVFDLKEGSVYPALHRLEQDGLLRSAWADVDGRRRRLYELTGAGERALAEAEREWTRFSTGVQSILARPA